MRFTFNSMTVREREQFRKDCETMTARDISEKYNITVQAAYKWADNLGCRPKKAEHYSLGGLKTTMLHKRPFNQLKHSEKEDMRAYIPHNTLSDLSKMWGVWSGTASLWCKKLGVKYKRDIKTHKYRDKYRGFEIKKRNGHYSIDNCSIYSTKMHVIKKCIDTYLKRIKESSFEMG